MEEESQLSTFLKNRKSQRSTGPLSSPCPPSQSPLKKIFKSAALGVGITVVGNVVAPMIPGADVLAESVREWLHDL